MNIPLLFHNLRSRHARGRCISQLPLQVNNACFPGGAWDNLYDFLFLSHRLAHSEIFDQNFPKMRNLLTNIGLLLNNQRDIRLSCKPSERLPHDQQGHILRTKSQWSCKPILQLLMQDFTMYLLYKLCICMGVHVWNVNIPKYFILLVCQKFSILTG